MRQKRVRWIIFTIVCLLVLIIFGGRSYVHRQIDYAIKAKLAEAFGKNIDADFRRSKIGLSENTLAFVGIDLVEKNGEIEKWSSHIEEFTIYGFDLFNFIERGEIDIDSVFISKPDIRLFNLQADSSGAKTLGDTISKDPISLAIKSIRLANGKFSYDPEGPLYFESEINFRYEHFDLDSIKHFAVGQFDNLEANLKNIAYQFPDSIYRLSLKELRIHPKASAIEIEEFDFNSNLSIEEFPAYFGWRKSRIRIQIPTLEIDKPSSLNNDLISISHVSLDSLSIAIDKDNRFPLPDRWTELPQEGLMKMVQKFNIDSINVTNSDLKFNSILENGDPALIELSQIDAQISGIQNSDSLRPAFILEANSKLMDQASLHVISVYKYGQHDPFTVNGTLGNTRLEFMDDYLQKVAGLKIADGILNRLDFEMRGNEYGTNGYVDFRYDNLQIHAVHKETGEDKNVVNFLSNLAGGLVFWQENPSKNQFRRGKFYVERDVRKGFMSQWIDGLIKGIVSTVAKVDPTKFGSTEKTFKQKKDGSKSKRKSDKRKS